MNKIYFPNLNALRFIAAALVIVHHVEQFKEFLGFENYHKAPFIQIIGKAGVLLFFVLSGFLITYLLLNEDNFKGEINIKKFYIRRILRIWPLYFIIIALSFFILPHIAIFNIGELTASLKENFVLKLFCYVFFLPNLALAIFPIIPFASQLWSVGYEEQFYLIWPVLIKKIKNKKVIFITIISAFIILKILVYTLLKSFLIHKNLFNSVEFFFKMPSIDCMAIGAWFGYLLFKKSEILKLMYHKYLQIVVYITLFILTLYGVFVPFLNTQVYAILFGIIILNLSSNPNSVLNLENKITNFLGKISYGIYMYHAIVIVFVLKSFSLYNIHNLFLENLFSISITVVISSLSYKYIEVKIIKLNTKI